MFSLFYLDEVNEIRCLIALASHIKLNTITTKLYSLVRIVKFTLTGSNRKFRFRAEYQMRSNLSRYRKTIILKKRMENCGYNLLCMYKIVAFYLTRRVHLYHDFSRFHFSLYFTVKWLTVLWNSERSFHSERLKVKLCFDLKAIVHFTVKWLAVLWKQIKTKFHF